MPARVQESELDDGWKVLTVSDILGGQNTFDPADMIDAGESPKAEGIRYLKNKTQIDTGYVAFGASNLVGDPRLDVEFKKKSGASELVLITDSTVYTWVEAQSEWQYVKGDAGTTTTKAESAGATSVTVASVTGFSASDRIGIVLASGKMHMTTIVSIASLVITIADAIPTGDSVNNGAAVIRAVVLNGTSANQVDATIVPSHDWLVFTNFVDPPQRYDGTDCVDVPNLPSSGNFKARTCAVYANYLLFGNTVEGGTAYPQRVRYPDTGDPTNWSTGNAGFVDLYDLDDHITNISLLGTNVYVFRQESITRGEHVGSTDTLFNWDTVVIGDGAVSTHAVAKRLDRLIFVGNKNVYTYTGGFDIQPIADNVYHDLFSVSGEIDPGTKDQILSVYLKETDEFLVYFNDSAGNQNRISRVQFPSLSWTFRTTADKISGLGLYQAQSGLRWVDMVGTWEDQTITWNFSQLLANSPTVHILDPTNNRVFEYNFVASDDNGIAISYELQTKDFAFPDRHIRFDRLECFVKGTSISLDYSVDQGVSWTNLDTLSPGTSFQRMRSHKQVVARQIRFRWKGSGGGFGLQWYAIKFREESELVP